MTARGKLLSVGEVDKHLHDYICRHRTIKFNLRGCSCIVPIDSGALLKAANSSMRLVSKRPSGGGVCQHLRGAPGRLNEVSGQTLQLIWTIIFSFFFALWIVGKQTGDHVSLLCQDLKSRYSRKIGVRSTQVGSTTLEAREICT